jgi:hypothetical protein
MVRLDGSPVACERHFRRTADGCQLIFVTFSAGVHHLHIARRSVSVSGSPFLVRVAAAPAFAPHCTVSGAGCTAARSGKLSHFLVHLRDRWHNVCTTGGARVSVKASGPTHPIISVLDLFDGSYQVAVHYGLSGTYRLAVTVRTGEQQLPVESSPLTVVVSWSPPAK